jgi:hypothetical protein
MKNCKKCGKECLNYIDASECDCEERELALDGRANFELDLARGK